MKLLHGGDIYRNKVEYDFSVNVNPLGMPAGSIEAAERGIGLSVNYPDILGQDLRDSIAGEEMTKPFRVTLGNGAAELIYAICRALQRPVRGLLPAPAFQEYELAIRSVSGTCRFYELKEEEKFQLKEDFLSCITEDISLVFLCNPNNPTGRLAERTLLERIAQKCEDTKTCLCIDECFLPFSEKEEQYTMKHQLDRFPHMLVLRAFTKIYGMPGLRLGYTLSADKDFTERLQLGIPPWNTSVPAQMAGIEALKDKEYLKKTRRLIEEEREYLMGKLTKDLPEDLVEKVYPSDTNFILFKGRADIKEQLLRRGILIRSCGNYRNLQDGFFRIAVRTHEENEILVSNLQELF